MSKICSICKVEKPFPEFHKSSRHKDGFKGQCKKCRNDQSRKTYPLYWKKRSEIIKSNPELQVKIAVKNRIWRIKNQSKLIESKKNSHKTPERKKYMRDYSKNRIKVDQNFRLRRIWHKRIWDALNNICCSEETQKILGTDYNGLRSYIESKFIDGMSWENYGKVWEIDHIIPAAFYDHTDPVKLALCNHYTNLQPLFKKDNLKKSIKNVN